MWYMRTIAIDVTADFETFHVLQKNLLFNSINLI